MIDVVDVVAGAEQPASVGSQRRRWPWVVAACLVLIVTTSAAVGIWFAHWRVSLRPLAPYPLAGGTVPLAAGHTLLFDDMVDYSRVFTHPRDPGAITLDIASIHPVTVKNTAGATVTVEKCVLSREGHNLLGVPLTAARERCSTLRPFSSGTVTLGFDKGDVDILVAIRPAHPGVVTVHGVRVSFSAGWRHGVQHTGTEAHIITR